MKIVEGGTLTLPYISAKIHLRESPNALGDAHVTDNSHFKNETMMVTAVWPDRCEIGVPRA